MVELEGSVILIKHYANIFMTDKNKTIHDFDFTLICDYFCGVKRQGPGSTETTLKALGFIEGLNEKSRIADIGCGTGAPTMTLARHTKGSITGVDLFPKFIDLFNSNVKNMGFGKRVKGIVASMDNLPFKNEEFDLIWSEGAIYNIGFENGLLKWRKFIKNDGYIAVSEASWFTEKRPEEINKFWKNAYLHMDTIGNKVSQMQKAGYIPVATFILPENCWIENFYIPQIKVQKKFLKKYAGNKNAEDFIANERRESALYQKYKKYYGYVFYIGKKVQNIHTNENNYE